MVNYPLNVSAVDTLMSQVTPAMEQQICLPYHITNGVLPLNDNLISKRTET